MGEVKSLPRIARPKYDRAAADAAWTAYSVCVQLAERDPCEQNQRAKEHLFRAFALLFDGRERI